MYSPTARCSRSSGVSASLPWMGPTTSTAGGKSISPAAWRKAGMLKSYCQARSNPPHTAAKPIKARVALSAPKARTSTGSLVFMSDLPETGGRGFESTAIRLSTGTECCGATGWIIGTTLLCCQSLPLLTHGQLDALRNLCFDIHFYLLDRLAGRDRKSVV